MDGNWLVSHYDEGRRKNGAECSTLASTYDDVHNAHRLVLVSSTLCAFRISIREYQCGIVGHLLAIDIEHVRESSKNKGYIPLYRVYGEWRK